VAPKSPSTSNFPRFYTRIYIPDNTRELTQRLDIHTADRPENLTPPYAEASTTVADTGTARTDSLLVGGNNHSPWLFSKSLILSVLLVPPSRTWILREILRNLGDSTEKTTSRCPNKRGRSVSHKTVEKSYKVGYIESRGCQ